MTATDLSVHPVHLGLGGTVVSEPAFAGGYEWYADYAARHAGDGSEGRLVSLFAFDAPWTTWEMHPLGAEVVVCLSGDITLHQEQSDGTVVTIALTAGHYCINAPGVWHTADTSGPASALFITAGAGTEIRAR